jgi:hypothetical protein
VEGTNSAFYWVSPSGDPPPPAGVNRWCGGQKVQKNFLARCAREKSQLKPKMQLLVGFYYFRTILSSLKSFRAKGEKTGVFGRFQAKTCPPPKEFQLAPPHPKVTKGGGARRHCAKGGLLSSRGECRGETFGV